MALLEDLKSQVTNTFRDQWTTRDGAVVPAPADLRLSNDAVEFDQATVLYADLSGSTKMVSSNTWMFAGEVYKTFLFCAAKIVRAEGGTITSYDGDRIMGVFVGDSPNTRATWCGLKINYAVTNIINPSIRTLYPDASYSVKHVVGVDVSPIRAARTGVRGDNDIVWIGNAANHAAKLTELNGAETTWITKAVYDKMHDDAKYGGAPRQAMWKSYRWTQNADAPVYGSTWWYRI